MALLIKSAINCARLTAQVKRLIVPQLHTVYSVSTYSSKLMSAMDQHEVVPDVIAVAPSDKIEVNWFYISNTKKLFDKFHHC